MTGERVLVVPRAAVPGGCDFRGIRSAGQAGLSALSETIRRHGFFMARDAAESDPAFKQVIPYVVVRDGGSVFVMRRSTAGGDARLHRRWSIGVGGHLNEGDAGEDPLRAGLEREWREELVTAWRPEFELVGLLNDDTNPVGAVHLGVVFVAEAAGRRVEVREREKLEGAFSPLSDLRRDWDALETWSQLVADFLITDAPHGPAGSAPATTGSVAPAH